MWCTCCLWRRGSEQCSLSLLSVGAVATAAAAAADEPFEPHKRTGCGTLRLTLWFTAAGLLIAAIVGLSGALPARPHLTLPCAVRPCRCCARVLAVPALSSNLCHSAPARAVTMVLVNHNREASDSASGPASGVPAPPGAVASPPPPASSTGGGGGSGSGSNNSSSTDGPNGESSGGSTSGSGTGQPLAPPATAPFTVPGDHETAAALRLPDMAYAAGKQIIGNGQRNGTSKSATSSRTTCLAGLSCPATAAKPRACDRVPPPPPPSLSVGWTPLWWDEFNSSSLDSSKWGYDLGNGDW